MRILPELTVDFTEEPSVRVTKEEYLPSFPLYFGEEPKRIPRDRPWYHLRYHSAAPSARPTANPELPHYETLHVLAFERYPETKYFLPHEGTPDEDGFPKIAAICLETSASRWFPPAIAEVRELTTAKRRLTKRKHAEWTRLDFLTREPLDVVFYEDGADYVKFDLGAIEFQPLPIRETWRERQLRSWATRKANLANRDLGGA